jgi:hypothetical protein
MKNIIVLCVVLMLIAGSSLLCQAEDPSPLLSDQKFMQTVVDNLLKESLRGGAFSTMIVGDMYINFTPEKPEQKPIFEFMAWANYLNTHRLLLAVYQNQNIDEATKEMVGNYVQNITEVLYDIGEKQFGWNKEQTDKIYTYCLGLINTRIKNLEETVFVGSTSSSSSQQQAAKPLPVTNSPELTAALIERCASAMMLQTQDDSPKVFRDSLDNCLKKEGYSYTATLQSLAEDGFGFLDLQNVMFLVMPALGLKEKGIPLSEVYNEQEVIYLQKIKENAQGNLDF